jgi:hypothetical protein
MEIWGVMRRTWRNSPGVSEVLRYFTANDGTLNPEEEGSIPTWPLFHNAIMFKYISWGVPLRSSVLL